MFGNMIGLAVELKKPRKCFLRQQPNLVALSNRHVPGGWSLQCVYSRNCALTLSLALILWVMLKHHWLQIFFVEFDKDVKSFLSVIYSN
jgi:hypothetical protein